jgi:2-iminobutanoate/2-iminopropanoate deaminase
MPHARRQAVRAPKAPKPIGPYSVGIRSECFVFASGMAGLDPATGELVPGGIGPQTRRTLDNLAAIFEAAGTSMANVVKTTVFLQDMADFLAMNAVYAEYFPGDPPARSTVQVAALPKAALVEIEAIALAAEHGE